MDFVLIFVFLIGGIYILVSGRIPHWLIGEKRDLSPKTSRGLGILLISAALLVILGIVLSPFFLDSESLPYIALYEWGILFTVSLTFIILVRTLGRKADVPVSDTLKSIKRKADGAFYYAIFSFAGPFALVCGPLAIRYANQAIQMITEEGMGEEYRTTARNGRLIAILSLCLWGLVLLGVVVILTVGGIIGR